MSAFSSATERWAPRRACVGRRSPAKTPSALRKDACEWLYWRRKGRANLEQSSFERELAGLPELAVARAIARSRGVMDLSLQRC